jgi:endonuclease/exonuclease/phosphatase family metal-dependent hydrolase
MTKALRLLVLGGVLVALGCTDAPPVGPEPGSEEVTIEEMRWHGLWNQPVKVFSRNMYIGFDVDETLAELATGDPVKVQAAIEKALTTLTATDIGTRAAAMAREIDLLRPDFLGLQEVSYIGVGPPWLDPPLQLNFLDTLQQKLADRQLNYELAAQVFTTNVQLPQLPGISLVDSDALLVNPQRVHVIGSDAQLYSYNLGDVFGVGIEIVRGWTKVHARVRGVEVEVWNTHLESGADAGIVALRGYQAGELGRLTSTAMPVFIMGDLNDELGSPMYDSLTAHNYDNVWAELRPWMVGNTCCHAPELWNPLPNLYERIDHVFVRDVGSVSGAILRTGLWPWERVQGPFYKLWASDHVGLFAAVKVPRRLVADD